MKIQITTKGASLPIYIPTDLVFNRVVGRLVMKKATGGLTGSELDRLFRELRRLGRQPEPWELVHVESKNGEVISITL